VESDEEWRHERVVRLAVQTTLTDHLLNPEIADDQGLCWKGLKVDLRSALLEEFDFRVVPRYVGPFRELSLFGGLQF
jgi:hypothetical protein